MILSGVLSSTISQNHLGAGELDYEAHVASWLSDDRRTGKQCRAKSLVFTGAKVFKALLPDLGFSVSEYRLLQESGQKVNAVNDRSKRKCDQSELLLTSPQLRCHMLLGAEKEQAKWRSQMQGDP